MKILFSWVGFKDLKYIGKSLDDKFRKEIAKEIEAAQKRGSTVGQISESPIAKIIEKEANGGEPFERVVLFFDLSNRILSDGIREFFGNLVSTINVVTVESPDRHHYKAIWKPSIDKWQQVRKGLGNEIKPYFNLSSGTTSMITLFIFLGSTDYPDSAHFLEVSSSGIDEFSIGFDLGSYAVNEALRQVDSPEFDSIIGSSEQMIQVKAMAQRAAKTDCNILIYGESGTGKELLANAIHRTSRRQGKIFRRINCAAIPASLLESLLFGYKKGAFTGANEDSQGLFEECDGGTLFLDEVEACAPEMQAKLLRALQPPEGKALTCRIIHPLGGQEKECDVRIIAATNERLGTKKEFRGDLLNRLSTLTLSLPALRDHPDDLPELVQKLFEAIKEQLSDSFKGKKLTESAIAFIKSRAWYGNVRELQNALTQAIVFGESDKITVADFDQSLPKRTAINPTGTPQDSQNPPEVDLSQHVNLKALIKEQGIALKRRYIVAALKKTGDNKTAAGKLLGISYQTLDNWKKEWEE